MAAQFLGANPQVTAAGLAIDPTKIPPVVAQNPDALVPYYFNLIAESTPGWSGCWRLCALAAMQSTGAAYMSTAGGILTRDLYKRYLNPSATHITQKLFGRLGITFIVICALLVATYSRDALVLLGGLAVAFGFQMWVPLLSVCYVPWITRAGATTGLAVGLIAVAMTDSDRSDGSRRRVTVGSLAPDHSLGRLGNFLQYRRLRYRVRAYSGQQAACAPPEVPRFCAQHTRLPPEKRKQVPLAWGLTIAWFLLGIGPLAVIGNWIFGEPGAGRGGWLFGIPSIWAWQILFWLLGIGLLWFLAYYMEMATLPKKQVEALIDDIGDTTVEPSV